VTPQERAAARLKLMLEARLIQRVAQTRCSDRDLRKAENVLSRAGTIEYDADPKVVDLARQVAHQRALRDDPNYLRDLCQVEVERIPVHIDTLPYEPPEPSDRAGRAQAALDELLLKDHRSALKMFPNYKEFIETHGATKRDQLEVGLRFQRKRFERLSRRRHCEIWAAIRSHDAVHRGPAVSPAGAKRKVAMF
jgi:hypothetical protein